MVDTYAVTILFSLSEGVRRPHNTGDYGVSRPMGEMQSGTYPRVRHLL